MNILSYHRSNKNQPILNCRSPNIAPKNGRTGAKGLKICSRNWNGCGKRARSKKIENEISRCKHMRAWKQNEGGVGGRQVGVDATTPSKREERRERGERGWRSGTRQ